MEETRGIVRIVEGSPLINKTIQALESDFDIKIVAKYNPYPAKINSKPVKPEDVIYEDLCLEYVGKYESAKKLNLASVGL